MACLTPAKDSRSWEEERGWDAESLSFEAALEQFALEPPAPAWVAAGVAAANAVARRVAAASAATAAGVAAAAAAQRSAAVKNKLSGAERRKRRGLTGAAAAFLRLSNAAEAEARVSAKKARVRAEYEDGQQQIEARFAAKRAAFAAKRMESLAQL